jgi:hypothetical protein
MSEHEQSLAIVDEIAKRYGDVIELRKSPFIMIEILRTFGHAVDHASTGDHVGDHEGGIGGSGGAPGAPPSSIAIAGAGEHVDLNDIMKVLLNVQREIRQILARLERIEKER